MRISDWSSDVCSSDLALAQGFGRQTRTCRGDSSSRRAVTLLTGMDGGLIRPGPSRSARRKIYAPMGGSDANGNSARRQGPLRSGRRRPFAERLPLPPRSEEHTSELQPLMRISYAVFFLKKKTRAH